MTLKRQLTLNSFFNYNYPNQPFKLIYITTSTPNINTFTNTLYLKPSLQTSNIIP